MSADDEALVTAGREVLLGEVRHAAMRKAEWERALIECVKTALHEGCEVAEVARAAAVTRQTVYRWRDLVAPDAPVKMRTGRLLDDALEALLVHGNLGPAGLADVTAALRSRDWGAKATRLTRGLRSAKVAVHDLPEDASLAVKRGLIAAEVVHRHGGEAPSLIEVAL